MIWLQTLPAFAVWLTYAYFQRRWMESSREKYTTLSRSKRIFLSVFALLFSLAWIAAGVWCLMVFKMASESGLTPLGMAFVCLIGLVFVHLQMLATALTFSLAGETVSNPRVRASNNQDLNESESGDN